MEEERLVYGYVSSPVKVGDTVRRQTGPWTPTIHKLLAYLKNNGFSYVPKVQGIDQEGREILDFIPGEAAVRPWPRIVLQSSGIKQAGRMLRAYHDKVQGFAPAQDAMWRIGKRDIKPGQIIRHGDLGPWNTIWQDEKLVALIDWDFAQPGERIEDLAQMAYYFVPLRGEDGWKEAGFKAQPDFSKRLKTLVDAYGMFSTGQVVDALLVLLQDERDTVERLGKEGIEPWISFLNRGDIADSLKDTSWIKNVKLSI